MHAAATLSAWQLGRPRLRFPNSTAFPPPRPPARRFTGADLYALCSDAWMSALKRAIAAGEAAEAAAAQQQQQAQQGGASSTATAGAGPSPEQRQEQSGGGEGEKVEVRQADFLAAAEAVQPSLSAEEVAKYEAIRDEYESQAAKARPY